MTPKATWKKNRPREVHRATWEGQGTGPSPTLATPSDLQGVLGRGRLQASY